MPKKNPEKVWSFAKPGGGGGPRGEKKKQTPKLGAKKAQKGLKKRGKVWSFTKPGGGGLRA